MAGMWTVRWSEVKVGQRIKCRKPQTFTTALLAECPHTGS
jgi:hypothetical protein